MIFTWSYSSLKNFTTCPKRHYHYDVLKDVKEPESEQLREGNRLHKVFEDRLKGTPLPLGFGQHESLLSKVVAAPGELHVELKLAITSSFTPVAYFGKDVWYRSRIDAVKVNGQTALALDWKSGRPTEDLTQSQLMASTLFAHMPALQRVKTALVFVGHDKIEPAEFVREDLTEIWGEILPRVKAMQKARQQQEYPPKPSGLCKKYCAVMSCPFHGKGG